MFNLRHLGILGLSAIEITNLLTHSDPTITLATIGAITTLAGIDKAINRKPNPIN